MKSFMIFGDSYSTHKDYIPEGYAFYYCTEGRSPDAPVTKMRPDQTWWKRMAQATGATLVHNNSWSGSTIGYTGYSGDCSTTSSFICRYRKLLAEGFFEKNTLDTILVFGGTNDSWSNAPLGKEQYSDWEEQDLFCVLPAICYFIATLRENHPNVRLIVIGNCDVKQEVIDGLKNAASYFGADFIELHDIDKNSGHPTPLGMEQICEQILEAL